ncbi:MAG: methyltransferase [Motilibacteraceae bacterium]
MADQQGDGYAVTAEFYDVLHGEEFLESATARLTPFARAARVGVLEVGAGTGLLTAVVARALAPGVRLDAVEPSAAMRAVLQSRLGLDPDLAGRVTVHACGAQDVPPARYDLVVAVDVLATLPPDVRGEVLRVAGERCVPAGVLVAEAPGGPGEAFGAQVAGVGVLGDDVVEAELRADVEEPGVCRFTYTYRQRRGGGLVREASESFLVWDLDEGSLRAELAEVGFGSVERTGDGLLVARRD